MVLTEVILQGYLRYLRENEKSPATIEKYAHDIRQFYAALGSDKRLVKAQVQAWKEQLQSSSLSVSSINCKLAAVNGLLSFMGLSEHRVKPLKRQRTAFCEDSRELSKADYLRLVRTAQRKGQARLALILETICSTGIRVSELSSITVEAVRTGRADLRLKGKCRSILLPQSLIRQLMRYIRTCGLSHGPVFQTRTGSPVSRHYIWAAMKRLCAEAGVERERVFPHNLRHLFARLFYGLEKDIAKLADLLGHSSLETTRIYIITSGQEHLRQMERLDLVPE